MTWRFAAGRFALQLVLPCALLVASPARAEPTQPEPSDLQSPAHRSTRYSAYTLPEGTWQIETDALGSNAGDIYGRIGVARGFAHGLQLDLNLLHWGAGLFGLEARWNFLETRHVSLAIGAGFFFAHGAWVWILGDAAEALISDADVLAFPLGITASAPLTRWLELDLTVQYRHAEIFGALGEGTSFYVESQLGARQLVFRPMVRVFLSDDTAFELAARLPVYNKVPFESDSSRGSRDGYVDVAFSRGWNMEVGVRSRLRRWLYATMRLQYGQIEESLYGAALVPSFGLEFRF